MVGQHELADDEPLAVPGSDPAQEGQGTGSRTEAGRLRVEQEERPLVVDGVG